MSSAQARLACRSLPSRSKTHMPSLDVSTISRYKCSNCIAYDPSATKHDRCLRRVETPFTQTSGRVVHEWRG